MKIISWNVGGLRAVLKKGFAGFLQQCHPSILCLQETKLKVEQVPKECSDLMAGYGYTSHWAEAVKKGYSGVATFSKAPVLKKWVGLGDASFDNEGRTLTTEHDAFYLVNCYFPNSQHGLLRLDYKLAYNGALLKHIKRLAKKKAVIVCGDFNVAHESIDLKNPKSNENNPGFYIDERKWFSHLLENGFTDTFRQRHPGEAGHYTWWSYRFQARAKDIGWRIDYFVVSDAFDHSIKSSTILKEVMGSDHCPIEIELHPQPLKKK